MPVLLMTGVTVLKRSGRRLGLAVLILLAGLTTGLGWVCQAQSARSLSGVVTHVIDGDTLVLASGDLSVTVRLEGIDAPERGQAFSGQSLRYLRVLAYSQHARVLVKETDRYGRLVGRVLVAGKDVSEEMVRAGLAWHYVEYSSDPRLGALEKQAREKQLGLWADRSSVAPWDVRHGENTRGPVQPSNRSPAGSEVYHGNVRSHVYHAPGCRDYDCKNCTTRFNSQEQAAAAGYRPHARCVVGR